MDNQKFISTINIILIIFALILSAIFFKIEGFPVFSYETFIFGGGIFCILKTIHHLFFCPKRKAEVITSKLPNVSSRIPTQDGYWRSYSYNFLIKDKVYKMPKNYYIGSKYKEGDNLIVCVSDEKLKVAVPILSVFNTFLIGLVLLSMAFSLVTR